MWRRYVCYLAGFLWLFEAKGAFHRHASTSKVRSNHGVVLSLAKMPEKPPLTPAQRAIQQAIREEASDFDRFKKALYEGMDTTFGGSRKPGATQRVVEGYKEIETALSGAPTQRLVKTLKEEGRQSVPVIEPNPTRSVFDSIKGAVYGTIDVASKISGSQQVDAETQSPLQRLQSSAVPITRDGSLGSKDNFRPVVKSRLAASKEILAILPDLKSQNPVKRKLAEFKIREFEKKENERKRILERQEQARKFKEDIYKIGDFVLESFDAIYQFPGKVVAFIDGFISFLATIPDTIVRATETAAALPAQVQKTANDVQTSVTTSVATAKKVVKDVQEIPDKVQKSAQETKESIEKTVETINELSTNVKVFLGLEKPKPRPPKVPPPKPPSAADVGWKVAGSLAEGTAKLAWWMSKGVLSLTWQGASAAVGKGIEAIQKQRMQDFPQKPEAEQPAATAVVPPPKPAPPAAAVSPTKSVSTPKAPSKQPEPPRSPPEFRFSSDDLIDDVDLDRQVAEALRLASEALAEAEMLDKLGKFGGEPEKGQEKEKKTSDDDGTTDKKQ